MDIDSMVSAEILSDNFSAVENIIARYGYAVIIADNMPKYLMTKYTPGHEIKPLVDESELVDLLNGIGKRVFVQYFEELQQEDVPDSVFDGENFTENSKRSRRSKARTIFKNGWERRALQIVVHSNRTDYATKAKAKTLLAHYWGKDGQKNEAAGM